MPNALNRPKVMRGEHPACDGQQPSHHKGLQRLGKEGEAVPLIPAPRQRHQPDRGPGQQGQVQHHQAEILLLEDARPDAGKEQQHVGCARGQAQPDSHRATPTPVAGQGQKERNHHRADGRGQQEQERYQGVNLTVQRVGDLEGEAFVVGQQPEQQPVEHAQRQRPAPRDDPFLDLAGRVGQAIVPGRQQQVRAGFGVLSLHRFRKGRLLAGPDGLLVGQLQRFGVLS